MAVMRGAQLISSSAINGCQMAILRGEKCEVVQP